MTGSRRYRKPLVSFEFGTRIYAPTDGEPRYQAVAPGVDGVQVSQKFTTEEDARRRFVPRSSLPTGEECNGMFKALEQSAHGLAINGTKNRQRRVTTFPASLVEPLDAWSSRVEAERGPEGLLFPDADGRFANHRWFYRVWARAAREAGWPMKRPTAAVWHPHDLRHVAACWLLLDVGLDPAVVAKLLGHANAAFTLSRYVGARDNLGATVTATTEDW
ncbi:MAG: tyrosine-type recombinase/integrase [Microthrixaceae bacterium]